MTLLLLVSFARYVQHHAEDLRSKIVNHEGQKELKVVANGTLFSAPYEKLAEMMQQEVMRHLNDPSLGAWIQPGEKNVV